MRLIDTAELYGEGRAESLISHVIAGQRERVFLVSKVLPSHTSEDGIALCLHEQSRAAPNSCVRGLRFLAPSCCGRRFPQPPFIFFGSLSSMAANPHHFAMTEFTSVQQ